ncbi:hypothetical protein [Salinibacter altiplanensis]|uniref:hypothetical protein n=1 Tax=Salinibacter altiplanensis TaxID=1803181 RepID=UPI001E284C45|nr:hypothetical protein [Salinibacter altiplanensis]
MSDAARERDAGSSAAEHDPEGSPEQFSGRALLLTDEEETLSEVPNPDVEALHTLVEEADCECAPYQSVAVAAVQILEKALHYERQAASAALSLGQQEKMRSMVETAEQAVSVLRDTLTTQGHKVMHLCSTKSPAGAADAGEPWWFTLSSALEMLEQGTDQMTSLTTGQSPGSAARELSQLIAQLLRSHHDELLLEAEEWIS